jgi:hypothetical protein
MMPVRRIIVMHMVFIIVSAVPVVLIVVVALVVVTMVIDNIDLAGGAVDLRHTTAGCECEQQNSHEHSGRANEFADGLHHGLLYAPITIAM